MHLFDNFKDLLFSILQTLEDKQIELMVMNMWSIWYSINEKLWSQKDVSVDSCIASADRVLQDWKFSNKKGETTVGRTEVNPQVSWAAPPNNMVKCNVDVAFWNLYIKQVGSVCEK